MQIIKEYVQTYPLEQFPLLMDLYNNLDSFGKEKHELWTFFIKSSLKNGLNVACRILHTTESEFEGKMQVYEALIAFIDAPERDWYYIGRSWKKNEEQIAQMLEEYSDAVFKIEDWNKEDMQKFLIQTLLNGDFEDS